MKIYYSVMASKSYRVDTWEICEGSFECNSSDFKFYLYEVILSEYARFTNLIAFISLV